MSRQHRMGGEEEEGERGQEGKAEWGMETSTSQRSLSVCTYLVCQNAHYLCVIYHMSAVPQHN